MNMPENPFLRAIRAGEKQIGLWVTLTAPLVSDVIAGAGFDWVVVDMEHSPNDYASVINQLRSFAGTRTTPLVRPDWNDTVKVKRLLDAGAPGLVFPMIQTLAEAQAAVAATRYPPQGVRGVAGTIRGSGFGRIRDYAQRAADETAVILQAETQAALAQVEDYAAIDGVDGIFFGPADIAADMGYLGQITHEAVWDRIMRAAAPLIAKGVPVGTLVGDVAFARKLLADGFTFVACGTDAGLLANATDQLVADLRAP